MGQVESASTEAAPPDEKMIVEVVLYDKDKVFDRAELTFSRDTHKHPPSKEQYNMLRTSLAHFFAETKVGTIKHPVIRVTSIRSVDGVYAPLDDEEHLKLRANKIAEGLEIPAEGQTQLPDIVRSKPILLDWHIPLHPDYRLTMAQLLYRACIAYGVWVIVQTVGDKNRNNVTAHVLAEYLQKSGREIVVNPKPVTDVRDRPGIYVTGGINSSMSSTTETILDTTLVFDDESRTFMEGPKLNTARYNHVAARMPNGDIIVAGGLSADNIPLLTCERLAAGDTVFRLMGTQLKRHRVSAACTVTPNGVLIICGGESVDAGIGDTIEAFDDASGVFKLLAVKMHFPRKEHTVTAISNHELVVCGGIKGHYNVPVLTCETIDLKKGTAKYVFTLDQERVRHVAVLLKTNTILLCGGLNKDTPTSAEVHDMSSGKHEKIHVDKLFHKVQFASLLRTGEVLLGGGAEIGHRNTNATQIYRDTNNTVVNGPRLDGNRVGCAATSY
jgi:hypothetical protein